MTGYRAAAAARLWSGILALALTFAAPVGAQEANGAAAPPERGPVTSLPLPRFVSLKASEGNARRGPGLTHRIDWVFRRRDMPLMVTAEFEHWRRVQDADGAGGWMHFALLSGNRSVLVQRDMTALHMQADERAPVVAFVERDVVAEVLECVPHWCRIGASGQRGWAEKAALWGVGPDEIIE